MLASVGAVMTDEVGAVPEYSVDWDAPLVPAESSEANWARWKNKGDFYEGVVVRYQPYDGAVSNGKPCGVLVIDPISTPLDKDPKGGQRRYAPTMDEDLFITISLDKVNLVRCVRNVKPIPGLRVKFTFVEYRKTPNSSHPYKHYEAEVGEPRPPEGVVWPPPSAEEPEG